MRQTYRIESVTLKDIGVFEHTHFDFPPIQSEQRDAEKAEVHIFTGPNGCGKSTILYALAAIFDPYVSDHLIASRIIGSDSYVKFSFNESIGAYYPAGGVPSNNEKNISLITSHLALHYYSDKKFRLSIDNYCRVFNKFIVVNKGTYDYAAFTYSGNRSEQGYFKIDSISEIKESPFDKALSFDKTIRTELLAQWVANNITKTALSKMDGSESEAKYYEYALGKISEFIFHVCQVKLRFSLKRKPLNVVFEIDDKEIAFDALPEGLRSIINWVSDLALRLEDIPFSTEEEIFKQPIILFLDEVDIHLHPKWQRRILPAIQKLLPNAQVFVSTHSPFVVGSVEDAWVYRLPDPQRNVIRDSSVAEKIVPTESGAGKSIQLILEEIFDVDERFDIETEQLLKSFKLARNQYLQNPADDSELMHLAHVIRERGEELETIIEMELRQIARRLKK
jgi:AAA15 family ATPase/GTPase